ncbi:MAG: phosphoribosylaminoimidazolesuccinocarboxamide synthase [Desulfobacca sp.]|nr:phosphoribosylaminoimidazolesuccinocarboxamide synthase [Desulfobacca sp.]
MIITYTDLPELGRVKRGKVRDIYDLGDYLLLVATDRVSAFDVILSDPIPAKGRILTQISAFWFKIISDLTPHHLISINVEDFPTPCQKYREILQGRSMLVKKAQPLPVECIVRGYLAGSGWQEYQRQGSICGCSLPAGLRESDRLPEPIFTPSTKAEAGTHDQNITCAEMTSQVGAEIAERVRALSLAIYQRAQAQAEPQGIIIADTKFEFGLSGGELILIDEILTPDSSRFWPRAEYEPGRPQHSFDKQYLRDYLTNIGWNRRPPSPNLPPDIIQATRKRYLEALVRLTGQELQTNE